MSPDHRGFIEKANLDGVVNVDVPEDLAVTAAASFGLPLVPIDQVDVAGITGFTSHPAALDYGPPALGGGNGCVIPAENSPLWQATAVGDLTSEHAAALEPALLTFRRAKFDYEIGEAQLWSHSLLGRTTVALREHWAKPAPMDSSMIIWLASGDALTDCVAFWNWRALRPLGWGSIPMLLLPADISSWTTWPNALHMALRLPDRFAPDVLLNSATVNRDGLDAFAHNMGLHLADKDETRRYFKSNDTSVRSSPFTYLVGFEPSGLAFDRRYGEKTVVDVPVVREKITIRFFNPVSVKPTVPARGLLRIAGGPYDALPQLDCVARLVADHATWRDQAIQLPDWLYQEMRLELRVPTLAAAGGAVLAERTQSHALSQKGAIGLSLLDDSAIEALTESVVYEAICKLTTPRSAAVARKLQSMLPEGRGLTEEQAEFAELFGGRSEQVYRDAARLGYGTVEAATASLERLVGIGWAERGLETICTSCGLGRFAPFSLDVARGPGRCPVCKMAADYTRSPHGLVVNYRLDGRVDHANDQGVVAHLMVVGALSRRYEHTWLVPGMDLEFHDGTKRECDVFGICDRLLVSGEVKMSGDSFTEEQIERDINTAARLSTNLHVMAAATPIPASAKDLARTRCAENDIELLLLERDDLRG